MYKAIEHISYISKGIIFELFMSGRQCILTFRLEKRIFQRKRDVLLMCMGKVERTENKMNIR